MTDTPTPRTGRADPARNAAVGRALRAPRVNATGVLRMLRALRVLLRGAAVMPVILAVAVGVGAAGPTAARAQAPPVPPVPPVPDSAVVRGAPISVQAARPAATAGGGSTLEVSLDSLRLPPAPTLEQVLRALPLVQVRTNSRGEAQFSLRGSGSDARQVAVLVDGIPLNLGWDHRADLSVLPVSAASSLTLVRGLPSVLHGPNVLGGVVEVGVGHHPGRWLPARSAELSAGVESTGGYALAASFAEPIELGADRLAVRAGAGYRARPGIALARGIVQPAPVPGEAYRAYDGGLRTNTDLQHADGFFALRYLAEHGTWATLSTSAFRAERGIASELHTARPRHWRYPHVARTVGVLSGGTGDRRTLFGGLGDLEASLGIDVGRTEIAAYETGTYLQQQGSEDGDDRTLTLRLLGDHSLGHAGELRGAFTYADIRHGEVTNGDPVLDYRQRIWSAGLETVWTMRSGLVAFPNVRLAVGGGADDAGKPLPHTWSASPPTVRTRRSPARGPPHRP
jgi:hypothetical protein